MILEGTYYLVLILTTFEYEYWILKVNNSWNHLSMKIHMQFPKHIEPIVDAKKTKTEPDYAGSEVSGFLGG